MDTLSPETAEKISQRREESQEIIEKATELLDVSEAIDKHDADARRRQKIEDLIGASYVPEGTIAYSYSDQVIDTLHAGLERAKSAPVARLALESGEMTDEQVIDLLEFAEAHPGTSEIALLRQEVEELAGAVHVLSLRVRQMDQFIRGGEAKEPPAVEPIEPAQEQPKASPFRDGQRRPYQISDREIDIVRLICSGASNKQIAAVLCLSEKTVKNHVSRIFSKMAITARSMVTTVAYRSGLVNIRDVEPISDKSIREKAKANR